MWSGRSRSTNRIGSAAADAVLSVMTRASLTRASNIKENMEMGPHAIDGTDTNIDLRERDISLHTVAEEEE